MIGEFMRAIDGLPLLVRLPIMLIGYMLICVVAFIPVMFTLLLAPFHIRSANVRRR